MAPRFFLSQWQQLKSCGEVKWISLKNLLELPRFYQQLLKLPLSLLVKPATIPSDPVADLELDLERPIAYILPYSSNTDLLTLRSSAKALGLPDPLTKLEIRIKLEHIYCVNIGVCCVN